MQTKKTKVIRYPWLSTLASLTAPLFGIMNSVDIFYGGLPLELALAFIVSLISGFIFFFFFDRMLRGNGLPRRILVAFLVLLFAVSFSVVIVPFFPTSRILIPPYRSRSYEGPSTYEGSIIFFALIGCLISLLTALGLKQWLRVLVVRNINHWFRCTISLVSSLLVLGASISSLLQLVDITLILVIVSLALPLLSIIN
jgi:ABC-type multidrug transport system permease subunit